MWKLSTLLRNPRKRSPPKSLNREVLTRCLHARVPQLIFRMIVAKPQIASHAVYSPGLIARRLIGRCALTQAVGQFLVFRLIQNHRASPSIPLFPDSCSFWAVFLSLIWMLRSHPALPAP